MFRCAPHWSGLRTTRTKHLSKHIHIFHNIYLVEFFVDNDKTNYSDEVRENIETIKLNSLLYSELIYTFF